MSDTPTPPAYADYPSPPAEPNGPATGVSNGRLFALFAGIAVLVGGAFAAAQIASGGGEGPTRAVDRLIESVEDSDLLGVLAALDPGERDAMTEPVQDLAAQLQRLGIASADLDLSAFAGVDIDFDGVEYEVESLTDDLVAVRLTAGTVTTTGNLAELPVGDVFEAMGIEVPDTVETETTDLATEDDVILVTARRGDTWYVSIGWSIADAARRDEGISVPDPETWLEPVGADTPEGVVDVLESALEELSLERFLAVMAPTEVEPLFAFAPMWIPDADAAVAEMRRQVDTLELDLDLDVASQVDGDRAHLTFHGFSLSVVVDAEGQRFEVDATYRDGCSTVTVDGPPETEDFLTQLGLPDGTVCVDELTSGVAGDEAQQAVYDLIQRLPIDLDALGQIGLEVVRVDGSWFLSPIRSSIDPFLRILGALDDDAIDWFATEGEAWAEDFFDSVFASTLGSGFGTTETFESQGVEIVTGGSGFVDDVPGSGQEEFCDFLISEDTDPETLAAFDC